jgi:hypothetical protein
MPDQIALAWTVNVAGTPYGPTQAASALAAVSLYTDTSTDPVLGQMLGLTVADDATTSDATSATRTLTLNMNASATPTAPPPFPCHPLNSTPPTLPYVLRTARAVPGSFFVTFGSGTVPAAQDSRPAIKIGDVLQFLTQPGVFYDVASVSSTTIGLTSAFTGTTGNSGAYKEIDAPATNVAIYSSSDLDTAGVATVPAIAAGPGARTIEIFYKDSTGAGPFSVTVSLTGKRPAAVTLAGGSIDIFEIDNILVASTGGFGNNIGEITLVELTADLPTIQSNATADSFPALTDEAQLLIGTHLAYLPPSYFAFAQQGAATPELDGIFLVSTGSQDVPTSEDQTSALVAGNTIAFIEQFGTTYLVEAVSAKIVRLTTPYTGIDTSNTGSASTAGTENKGTKGNIGTTVSKKPTSARLLGASVGAPPSNAELATPLAQFVAPATAAPPPAPPLDPSTILTPTFLSGFYTRTLQLALAGIPITSATITLV